MTKPLSLIRMSKNVLSYYNQSLVPVRTTSPDKVGVLCHKWSPVSNKNEYAHTHTRTSPLLLLSLPRPSLSVSARLYPIQPVQSCLPVRTVLQYRRLGYPPPGPRTRASHRCTPRLGLCTAVSDHGNHRYIHQVYRRVSAV